MLRMKPMRRRDIDGIDGRIGRKLLIPVVNPGIPELGGKSLTPLRISRRNGRKAGAFHHRQGCSKFLGDLSGTNDPP